MKNILPGFTRSLLLGAISFLPLNSQEPDFKAPYSQPPQLELKFKDEFQTDSRVNYQINGTQGAVGWEKGKLILGDGAILQRKLNAGPWLEIELDLEFPELVEDGQTSDLKIGLDFDGATDSFAWFRQKRENGKTRSAIFIVDTEGEWDKETKKTLVSQRLLPAQPLSSGKWTIRYRRGLWSVDGTDMKEPLFGQISNGSATISGIILTTLKAPSQVVSATVSAEPRNTYQYSKEEQDQLTLAGSLYNEVAQQFAEGSFADALPRSKKIVSIRKNLLGKYHSSYVNALNQQAMLFYATNKMDQAKKLFLQATEIDLKVLGTQHLDYAAGLNNLAMIYKDTGEMDKAEPLFLQASAITGSVLGKLSPSYAVDLNNLGLLYLSNATYEKAEPLFLEAKAILETSLGKKHPYYAKTLSNLANLYQAIGDYEKTELLFKESNAIFKSILGRKHPDYALGLSNLGHLYEALGEYERAESLFEEAKSIFKSVFGRQHSLYASSLNNLAMLYQATGAYEKAEHLLTEAITIAEETVGKQSPLYATALNNLATLNQILGKYEKSEPLFLEVKALREKLLGKEHPDYAGTVSNLAEVYSSIGNYGKAVPLYLEASTVMRNVHGKNHPDYATTLLNLAAIYQVADLLEKAEPLLLEANAIYAKTLGKKHPKYASGLNNLGIFYISTGQHAKAEAQFVEIRSLQKQTLGLQHPDYARTLDNLASTYMDTDFPEKAESLLLEANAIRQKSFGKMHPDYIGGLTHLAKLYRDSGAYEKAEPLLEEVLNSTRSNFERYSAIQSETQQRAYSESFDDRFSDFVINALRLKNRDQQVFEHAIRWKGMTLIRQRQNFKLLNNPETRLVFDELRSVKSQLTKHFQTDPNAKSWHDRRDRLMAKEESLEKNISSLAAQSKLKTKETVSPKISLPLNSCLIDFRRINFPLPPTTPQGEIKFGSSYIALVLLHDQTVKMFDLGSGEIIDSAIRAWRRPFETANQNSLSIGEAGFKLRQLLWEPLQEAIANAELIIVSPDGAIGQLPLIALPGKKKGTFLIEEKKIVYAAVPRLLPEMLSTKASPIDESITPLLVGEIDYGKIPADPLEDLLSYRNRRIIGQMQFPSLPQTATEVAEIKKRFKNATLLSKKMATEDTFVNLIVNHQLIHIATHGFFRSPENLLVTPARNTDRQALHNKDLKIMSEDPNLLSGLAFANANGAGSKTIDDADEDGILFSAEIAMLPMEHVELAVLSACETSLGSDDSPGEGLIGIQRAFQVAGAKSTIASYWKVDDSATQLLMNKFYENLIEYSKKAKTNGDKPNSTTVRLDALRDAQLWMLNNPVVASNTSRGTPVEIAPQKFLDKRPVPDNKGLRTHPRFWAGFILSGDWR